jgi:hypothetical protein
MGLTLGLWAALSAGVASAASIAWVSVNADDTGQDQGFVDLLRGAGHTVTRVQRNGTGSTLTPEKIATLNASDLVIVGRAVNSGDFDTAANATFWNTELTKPVMYNSAYLVRRNRLGMSTGDGVPDSQATPLVATNASHPIFNGITFAGDGVTMANPYNTFIDRGTTAMGNLPRNGTVLATNPAVAGGVAIAEWAAGTTVQDEGNIDYVLAGPRYFFAGGSRELDQTAITTAGKMDLTADGQQLFLNTVNYALIPEPSTAVLLGFGLAVMLRRSRR